MTEETKPKNKAPSIGECIGSYLLSDGLNEFNVNGAGSYDFKRKRLRLWQGSNKNPIPEGIIKIKVHADHRSHSSNYSVDFE